VIEADVEWPEIAPLDAPECDAAADVLARAFRDNPLNRAVIQSEDADRRVRVNRHGMVALLPAALAQGRVLAARDARRVVGALIGVPPGAFPLPPPPLPQRLRCLVGQGWRVALRWGQVFRFLEERHPCERHWYLGTLGVDPAFQHRGVGGCLLAAWLRDVDRDGDAAYLETDLTANVDFYQRAGFALAEETEILGATVWRMRRPPHVAAISTASLPQ
jgi:ribosomal protein S18 acetylase RimI-like enzyme